MATGTVSDRITHLFEREEWEKARKLLEGEREKAPDDHWVLTQLGVTFYEQKRYEESLKHFLASLEVVPDCPLTLWNVAGALDALGKYGPALEIYTWLLESKKSPEEDPCWESREWADALKADCVYRLGGCFRGLGSKKKAEHCYRQYLNLLLVGMNATYSLEDVTRQIRSLHEGDRPGATASELRKAVASVLEVVGVERRKGSRSGPTALLSKLLGGHRAASA